MKDKLFAIRKKNLHKVTISEKKENERLSLKTKMIMSHIMIAVLPIMIIVLVLTTKASTSLLEKVTSSNLAYVTKTTKILDGSIDGIENISKLILSDLDLNMTIAKNSKDYLDAVEMMQERKNNFDKKVQSLQFSNKFVNNIFIVKKDEIIGNIPFDRDTFAKMFFESEIYQQVVDSQSSSIWFHNLYDTQDLYLMRSLKSISTGDFIGVLIIQVKKDLFIDDLKSDFGSLAQLALIDDNGKVVVIPKDQGISGEIQYIAELKEQMNSNIENKEAKIGTFRTQLGMESENTVLYGNCSNNWIYLLQIPISEYLSDIQEIQKMAFNMTAVVIILAILIGVWMALSVSKPIDYIRKKMKLVEQGDLTVQSKYIGNHEIGQLSQSFNHMTMNMKNLLQEVRIVVERVSSNSSELNQIAKSSSINLKEVILAVETVANGATDQAKNLENTDLVIKELMNQFDTTEEHFSYVVNATNKTREVSQGAKIILETLNLTTSDTMQLSKDIQKDIQNLVNRFVEISSITQIIDGISKQTNLLALNAAIEAARAGEAGKSFAVVADEVRKLATQSSDAVKNISNIIKSINEETKKTEKMIEIGSAIYIKQEKAVANTETTFNEIVSNMDTIMTEVDFVYKLIEGLDEVQKKATESITNIAEIAEASAAAVEEVLASGQEQLASAEQLVSMSVELGDVITVMNNQISQFNFEKHS